MESRHSNRQYKTKHYQTKKEKKQELKGLLGFFFWLLNFHHSSFITQFFTLVWHHQPISITQYFSHYLWVHTYQSVQLFFFFLFSIPKLTEALKKKKKKKKKKRIANPGKERKKESKVAAGTVWGSPMCV